MRIKKSLQEVIKMYLAWPFAPPPLLESLHCLWHFSEAGGLEAIFRGGTLPLRKWYTTNVSQSRTIQNLVFAMLLTVSCYGKGVAGICMCCQIQYSPRHNVANFQSYCGHPSTWIQDQHASQLIEFSNYWWPLSEMQTTPFLQGRFGPWVLLNLLIFLWLEEIFPQETHISKKWFQLHSTLQHLHLGW